MKVKVLKSFRTSASSSVQIMADSILDVPYHIAKHWITSGIVEEVKEPEKVTPVEKKIVAEPANKVNTKREKK